MPQKGATELEYSLFSLELVVEKVYIPHTPCRFPAVAFRLLDFPTIVIKHVDDELGKAIRRKISFDPYYQLPDQFIELKDRHGNFMVNKGKSCLFKIPVDVLKQHLASTPLYVMIIDLFPEVPKLVGNSSVPLNTLMDLICIDIVKLGSTVPTVHGDKGLFRLYNLMGKEIGYFVLGFRLLCLGPSLIPHLPSSVLLQQHSKRKKTKDDKLIDEIVQKRLEDEGKTSDSDELEVELRSSACMTDPVRHDVLLQTVEMEDKAVHVMMSGVDNQMEIRAVTERGSSSISTQTEKSKKKIKEARNAQQKWVELTDHKLDDVDDIIINNIICPPPLFYNSDASPAVKIDRQQSHQRFYGASLDDLSDIESYDGHGLEKVKQPERGSAEEDLLNQPQTINFQPEMKYRPPVFPVPLARAGEIVQGLQVAPKPDTVFPLLTALIQELSCIQSPELLLNVSNRLQAASFKQHKPDQPLEDKTEKSKMPNINKLSPSVVSTVAAALTKKLENSKENRTVDKLEKPSRPKVSQSSAVPHVKNAVNRQDQKQCSAPPSRKTKLVYGITNTQRLRLQKTNPQWLKIVDKEAEDLKIKKNPAQKQSEVLDVNASTFSDTLTEVRRMAEKELNSTGYVHQDVSDEVWVPGLNQERIKKTSKSKRSVLNLGRKSRLDESRSRTSSQSSLQKTPSPKRRSRSHHVQISPEGVKVKDSSEPVEFMRRKPVPQERQMKNFMSPSHDKQEISAEENDGHASPDLLSSKSRSLEVRLPSHDLDDRATATDADDSDDDIPLPDDSFTEKGKSSSLSFPKYLPKDASLPESIEGTANGSLNVSGVLDDNSPLESTRQSKFVTSDQCDSKIIHSADYDSHQFQSTDEPELQDLVSEEESPPDAVDSGRRSAASLRASQKFPVINPQLSENSPVPSLRRSTNKQDPTAQSYLPSMSHGPDSPISSRATTHTLSTSSMKGFRTQPFNPTGISSQVPDSKGGDFTPRMNITPRSTSSSPRRPTPQHRRPLHESLHTDSLSSYMPSDPDNVMVSLSSNSGSYSDDFLLHNLGKLEEPVSSEKQLPKLIPSSKLGFTIH